MVRYEELFKREEESDEESSEDNSEDSSNTGGQEGFLLFRHTDF
jgi:hypothetical protein